MNDIEERFERAVAIISSREDLDVLESTVVAAITACGLARSCVDVLINGNAKLAIDFSKRAKLISCSDSLKLRVWSFSFGDKAATWNSFCHQLWRSSSMTFFLDGYARPKKNAFDVMESGLPDEALAVAAVPSVGLSARRLRESMIRSGGLHGNLFSMTEKAMRLVRASSFNLPVGIYRTDALIGAALCFGFDPPSGEWRPERIHVSQGATWEITPLKWWRFDHLMDYRKRRKRQLRGRIENLSYKQLLSIDRIELNALPATVGEMLINWYERLKTREVAPEVDVDLVKMVLDGLTPHVDFALVKKNPECIFGD